MNKILLAFFVCVISVNVLACDGSHDDDNKDDRFQVVTTNQK